ncbi:NERD domain-containing protein [Allofournierella massiliensis]|uniref:NERD domain-containing protein n=1 Tax=Allofournierella massiliensis TaxID=1650663 RepID=A0ABT7UU29_9FIRM|nr:NERD domain-containing protein [Fournierella massiliensis]MDM8202399.1 NERD domain-containing protein [Fournierella massiliensis]
MADMRGAIMARKGLLDIILDSIFDDEWKGKYGEKLTERELKWVQLFGRKGKTLRNVYLPTSDGGTSEIDVLFITQKGIFVFESKNYSGWIFGDEKSRNWTAMLPNRVKNQFYNPIMQNRTHLKWLANYVGDDVPLFSIIVFSERCELKKVTVHSENIKVIKRDSTYATVLELWEQNPDCIEADHIEELYQSLKRLTNVDEAVKAAHVANIKNRFQKPTNVPISTAVSEEKAAAQCPSPQVDALVCPRCGAKLVLREATKGVNAGNKFYGCSRFPKCRYIRNLEKGANDV